jgi:hypothetical protein
MTRVSARLKEYEKSKDTKLVCPISNYPCRKCLKAYIVNCKKLEKYLDTGKWE